MKTEINYHQLTIPLEFRVACAVYRLDEQEVLQIFINHATVYDSLADQYSEGYSDASKTIGLFVVEKRRTANGSHAFSHCLANTANCFRWINELAEKVLSSAVAKRKKSLLYIDELYNNMQRVYTSSDTFYLDENRSLSFTKDFTVLCELHNCYPAEYLENFMGKISIAEMQARTGLKIPNDNFTMAFFMKIVLGFGRQNTVVPEFTDKEVDFICEMDEIRLHIHNVRSLQQRITILKEFYHKHYQDINNHN